MVKTNRQNLFCLSIATTIAVAAFKAASICRLVFIHGIQNGERERCVFPTVFRRPHAQSEILFLVSQYSFSLRSLDLPTPSCCAVNVMGPFSISYFADRSREGKIVLASPYSLFRQAIVPTVRSFVCPLAANWASLTTLQLRLSLVPRRILLR